KVEAAVNAGLKNVIIPASNARDLYLSKEVGKKINIVKVKNIVDVLNTALEDCTAKKELIKKIKRSLD
ncbi:ATP-dependent protease LonB, partial [Candidatus Micrarchaeota archaeon]|nr:ATP-dependent protease LonB [Candidatus Micrarchaeota archaeon]